MQTREETTSPYIHSEIPLSERRPIYTIQDLEDMYAECVNGLVGLFWQLHIQDQAVRYETVND